MSGSDGSGPALIGALKDFNAHWERTAAVWHDAARARFEEDFIRELTESIRSAANAIGQIEVLLNQIRRDCA
jgi:hypothetical protein